MKNIIGINPAGGYIYEDNACTLTSNATLAEVRAIIDSLYGRRIDDMYSQALDDIKEKLGEHFA